MIVVRIESDSMASSTIMFPHFDPLKDKTGIFLTKFHFHVRVNEKDASKASNLILSSFDGETSKKILILAKPKLLKDLQLSEIDEQRLPLLLNTPTSFRVEWLHFHTVSQQIGQPLAEFI